MAMLLSKWEIAQLRRRYSAIPTALEWLDAQTPDPEQRPPRRRGSSLPCRRAPRRRISLDAAAIELARQARDDDRDRSIAPSAANSASVYKRKAAGKTRRRKRPKPRRRKHTTRKAIEPRPLTPGELALAELRSRREKRPVASVESAFVLLTDPRG